MKKVEGLALLVICLSLVSAIAGVGAGEKGVISISTIPVSGKIYIDGNFVGNGDYTGEYAVGNYTISFGKIEGYYAPRSRIITLEANETEEIIGVYERMPNGTLCVITAPVDGDIYVNSKKVGKGSFEKEYPENTVLEISFGDVEGYYVPESQEAIIISNKTTEIRGEYREIPRGWVNVTTISDDGRIKGDQGIIYIDGKKKGVGMHNESFYENTEHVISFENIEGYFTPENRTVIVKANETIHVVGRYIHRETYFICITTISDDGRIKGDKGEIFVDGEKVGIGTAKVEVYVNTSHTISFGSIEGYYSPNPVNLTTKTNDTYVQGEYKKIPKYKICVVTEPVEGDIYLNGVWKGKGSAEEEYYENTNLTISFGEVGDNLRGYYTPESFTITVKSNETIERRYKEIPTGTIEVVTITEEGREIEGEIYIDGKPMGSGDCSVECRIDRPHTVSFGFYPEYYDQEKNLQKYETPSPIKVEVAQFETKEVKGVYRKVKYNPEAKIMPEVEEVALNNEVKFTAEASYDLDGSIEKYIWDLDGEIKYGKEVIHRFTKGGERTVKLTIIDDDFLQDTDEVTITVRPEPTFAITKVNDTAIRVVISSPLERPPIIVSFRIKTDDPKAEISEPSFAGIMVHVGKDLFKRDIVIESKEGCRVWLEGSYYFEGNESKSKGIKTESVKIPPLPGGGEEVPNLPTLEVVAIIIISALIINLRKRR